MKLRIFALCLTVVLIFSSLSFLANAEEASIYEKEIYLTLGDSISTGFALKDPKNESFANLVAYELGLTLQGEAVNNSTASDVLRKLKTGKLDSYIDKASLITVTCGGNDMMDVVYKEIAVSLNEEKGTHYTGSDIFRAFNGETDEPKLTDLLFSALPLLPTLTELPSFAQALETYRMTMFGTDGIISYLRKRNPEVVILVATQYNPYQSFDGLFTTVNTSMELGVQKLNEAILADAPKAGCYASDVYKAFSAVEENLCNCRDSLLNMELDFHPNKEGHRLIADTIAESYRASQFGIAGYQLGLHSVRLVGYVNTVYYDNLYAEITVENEDGKKDLQRVPIITVYRTLNGTKDGAVSPAVSCDGTVSAPHILPYSYLFVYELKDLPAGYCTVTLRSVAIKGGIVFESPAQTMRLSVSDDNKILVLG